MNTNKFEIGKILWLARNNRVYPIGITRIEGTKIFCTQFCIYNGWGDEEELETFDYAKVFANHAEAFNFIKSQVVRHYERLFENDRYVKTYEEEFAEILKNQPKKITSEYLDNLIKKLDWVGDSAWERGHDCSALTEAIELLKQAYGK